MGHMFTLFDNAIVLISVLNFGISASAPSVNYEVNPSIPMGQTDEHPAGEICCASRRRTFFFFRCQRVTSPR